jgi:hypothetical protein
MNRDPRMNRWGRLLVLALGACARGADGGNSQTDATADAAAASRDSGESDAGADHDDAGAEPDPPWPVHRGVHHGRYVPEPGVEVRDVAIGRHLCVLDGGGGVRCQSVTGQFEDVPLPAPAKMLSSGDGGTCALLRTGEVACWGCAAWPPKPRFADDLFQAPLRLTGVAVLPLPPMKHIAVGAETACGVRTNGRVVCWGALERQDGWSASRSGAEICHGGPVDELPQNLPPALAVALSTNSWSASAWLLGADHRARVREELPQDEVGMRPVRRRWSARLIDLGPASQIGTGDDLEVVGFFPWGYGCILHVQGDVSCKYGFPLDWGTRRRWKQVYKHGCALLGDGRAACWGYNRFGQAPSVIGFPAPAKELAVGSDHGCALLRGGRVACWGANPEGLTGPPLTRCKAGCSYTYCDSIPHVVPDLRDVIRVRAGGTTTCAVQRDGGLVCWDLVLDRGDRCDVHPG